MDQPRKRLALIATKGSLDMAYPPFVLASAAAALGHEVTIFFSFYGLALLKKSLDDVRISPLGNPAMPMPMPMPTMAMAMPGMEAMATRMMNRQMKQKGIAPLQELRSLCLEAGVRFVACDMTMNMFDLAYEDLIEEVTVGGAATFIDYASEADISLFV